MINLKSCSQVKVAFGHWLLAFVVRHGIIQACVEMSIRRHKSRIEKKHIIYIKNRYPKKKNLLS